MSPPSEFDIAKLENLAERIYQGQVVFFVGAGFSLDSEGLSTYRLLLRLLARFDGFSWVMARAQAEGMAALAKQLRVVLRTTFALGSAAHLDPQGRPAAGDVLTTGDDAWKLANDYYRANEWLCTAFGSLLGACAGVEAGFWRQVHQREAALLAAVPVGGRVEQLPAIEPRLLDSVEFAGGDRGKALFVDTLGFADPEVMAGRPHAPSLVEVAQSYGGAAGSRLRPRHHVLARWARDGLCRMLLTTNYDLLLEGAYRLAGFACRYSDRPGQEPESPPLLTEVSHFTRIGEAVEFFRFGNTHRSALIAKIHGCAERYRLLRAAVLETLARFEDAPTAEHAFELAEARRHFANYLPAIVFTFREIQNWRHDAWSRDLLANLLRTRSIVFCGYSAQDRVLHDAFRTVYEEMAAVHQRTRATTVLLAEVSAGRRDRSGRLISAGAGAAAEASRVQLGATMADARNARAFFLGVAGRLEFDALEVLRAASRAEGIDDPPQTDHPNYLQFHVESDADSPGFPSLDQSMRWLWHRTARIRQQEALEVDLRRVAAILLGHPGAERERARVIDRLLELTAAELALGFDWESRAPAEAEFDRVVGWSDRFFIGLLREFAMGEALLRRRGPGYLGIYQQAGAAPAGAQPWFFPPSEHPQWAAWATVVEIGLRRMIACWQHNLDDWARPTPLVAPGHSQRAAVSFSRGTVAAPSTPRALAIALTGFDRRGAPSRVRGAFAGRLHHWRLRGAGIPWWGPEQRPLLGTPSAATLWAWATGEAPSVEMVAGLDALLGVSQARESGYSRPLRVA